MKKGSIIFDLDGTLWEVTDVTLESVNIITKKYNIKEVSRETICSVFGLNRIDSSKKYFPDLDSNMALKLIDEVAVIIDSKLKENGGNVYDHVKDVIIALSKEYDLYIVSNTSRYEYIEAFLNPTKLKDYFIDYIPASALKLTKEEAIRKVIKDYKIKNAVYVGDTKKDYDAAAKANIPFVQAKYGFGEDLNSKYSIDSIDELPQTVKEILGE